MDDKELLLLELEHYRGEKERIRRILGQIGGAANLKLDRTLNILFLALVVALFALDVVREVLHMDFWGLPHFLSTQLALFLVSMKIVWMIHRQTRVDHFQFWILNSIEFQLNQLSRRLDELRGKPMTATGRQARARRKDG